MSMGAHGLVCSLLRINFKKKIGIFVTVKAIYGIFDNVQNLLNLIYESNFF